MPSRLRARAYDGQADTSSDIVHYFTISRRYLALGDYRNSHEQIYVGGRMLYFSQFMTKEIGRRNRTWF